MQNSPMRIWREKSERYRYLGKVGVLASVTRIMEGTNTLPYWVGMVEFANRERTTGKLIELGGTPKSGQKVEGVLRKVDGGGADGVISYGICFRLVR